MKTFKYFITGLLGLLLVTSCQDDTADVGDITAPSNVVITTEVVGIDANNPNGDGSGTVNFKVNADNALAYHFVYNGETTLAPQGEMTYDFAITGLQTYTVTVIAYGTGGNSTSKTVQLEVLALYEAPADLLDMLVGNTSKTWRIKSESAHFGLGPVGGGVFAEWFSAGAETKAGTGMYDDRYVFNADGTFTHITNGTVFGRENLINEIGGPGDGTADGADILNYSYGDYTEGWSLNAPGGIETLSLTGLGFMGYYTGGNHKYEIFARSASEMTLRTTDGNGEFDWWFVLTSDDGSEPTAFVSEFNNLSWSDEFDTDGSPDSAKWGYDIGAGGWGNNEVQTYTNESANAIVEGGFLKINAIKDGVMYTSARLKSQGLYDFTYGRVDVRAKLPASAGTWPAIWMLGANFETIGWPASGEIDIMEQTGGDKNSILGTFHWLDSGTNTNASYGETATENTSTTDFHIYSLEWTTDKVIVLIDNVPYTTLANNADLPFNADFFLILNIAMGGTLGGDIDAAFTQDTMEIDYVRVYQ
ncbi:glycoside hydrolase family 16 protein [Aureibaculum luteum]|uniref:glycoside hydrolase family 16 protein n=1 Tax=Aureibaculum luteum TaxID=1548456 RepID=UPI000E4B4FEE|nr:glycoside hydrolase family 16 protein [Aureibaculum luteum]